MPAAPDPAEPHVTAVIFDIGGVIVDWNPRHLYSTVIEDPDELDHFLGTVCPLSWHYQHDRGVAFAETLPVRSAEFPEHAELIAMWGSRYGDMTIGEIAGTAEVIDDLHRAGVGVFGISNMPAEVWPDFVERWPVIRRLTDTVISGRDGVAKPDAEIFELALDRFGLDAASTVFVDDSPANVAGADAVGITGVLFTSADELRADLRRLGLAL